MGREGEAAADKMVQSEDCRNVGQNKGFEWENALKSSPA